MTCYRNVNWQTYASQLYMPIPLPWVFPIFFSQLCYLLPSVMHFLPGGRIKHWIFLLQLLNANTSLW